MGGILFNLMISVVCYKTKFEKGPLESSEDQIEKVGVAMRIANEILAGEWHVTERGYLIRGIAKDVDVHHVKLEVDQNVQSIINLSQIMRGAMVKNDKEYVSLPDLHFENGDGLMHVGADENGLYIVEIFNLRGKT